MKVFAKSEKASYFGSIKNILGIENLSFIDKALDNHDPNGWGDYYLPRWSGSGRSVNLKILTNYENLKDK